MNILSERHSQLMPVRQEFDFWMIQEESASPVLWTAAVTAKGAWEEYVRRMLSLLSDKKAYLFRATLEAITSPPTDDDIFFIQNAGVLLLQSGGRTAQAAWTELEFTTISKRSPEVHKDFWAVKYRFTPATFSDNATRQTTG